MRRGWLALLVWVAWCAGAHADEGVVLREHADLRKGLCGALRIQLADAARVHCETELGSEPLAERIAKTAARVRELGARLGVLLERDPDPGRIRMYVVAAEGDQAVIALERIEDRPEPDVDRSLALKVRDAYEVVRLVQVAQPTAQAPLAGTLAPQAESDDVPPARSEPNTSVFLDAGGGLSAGQRLGVVASIWLGLMRTRQLLRMEAGLGARFTSPHEERRAFGRVSLVERGPVASLRLLRRGQRFEIGGFIEAGASFVAAQGTAADGTHGARTLLVPAIGVGPDLRVRLFASAFLRLAPTLQVFAVRQRLAVDQHVLIDEGRTRLLVPLSLLVSLPLRSGTGKFQP